MADIIEMILIDHRRIRCLTAVLEMAHGHWLGPHRNWALTSVWDQLVDLLEMHTSAEEEICYLPMFGRSESAGGRLADAVADHADIREAADEARLQPAGSALWWLAVDSALSACADHLSREESGVLAAFADRAGPALRQALGHQWSAFRTAWMLRPDGMDAAS